jgi:hypothetical protein
MPDCQIRLAHSRGAWGFTVYSFELYPSQRYRATKAGFHVTSDETLAAAMARARAKIREDWRHLPGYVPPVVDCGRVADARGKAHAF